MLEWIVTSSLLILVVLALRRLLRSRLSGRVRYALWGLVLLRLLIPVQLFSASVSVGDYLPQPDAAVLEERTIYVLPVQEIPLKEAGLSQAAEDGQVVSDTDSFGYARVEGDTVRRYAGKITPIDLALWVWGSGCALALLALLWSNLRFARRLRHLRRPLAVKDCPLPVCEAEGLPSPCLFGLLRPAIYITPEAAGDPVMFRHVLAHETTHFRQGDHVWSALRAFALALHWYNPLVWWAVVASKEDGELSCDEGAIRRLGEGERQAYGETLLRLLTVKPSPRDLFACATTMSEDKKSLRERFSRISRKRKTLVGVSAAVVLAAAAAALFLFAGGGKVPGGGDREDPLSDPQVQIPELALDVVTVEGAADGGFHRKTVLELPRFLDGDDPVLRDLNARMAEVKAEYDALLSDSGGADSATLYAYPCLGSSCVSVVFLGREAPSYGTDGDVTSFCYDFVEGKEVTLEEALAASRWTEEAIRITLSEYIATHLTEFGYPENAASYTLNLEIPGFRQRMDGGWDFFLLYRKLEGESTAWRYLLTFSDGAIQKGVAIPPEEILDIGCSLEGLAPYTAEGRSVVKTADAVMADVAAEDILYVDYDRLEPEAVAAALNGAAAHTIDAPENANFTWWWWDATLYLEGGPDTFGSDDRNLLLQAGRLENVVFVRYGDHPFYHTVYVEDEALYTLLRESYNSEEGSVDQAAAERYADLLDARMEATLETLWKNDAGQGTWTANYTGCELLDFQKVAVYDDLLPGQVIHVYSFHYAVTVEHPENIVWIGGSYLDGERRLRGMDNLTYFAAALDENGQLTETHFFDFELFWGMDEASGERNARNNILYSFTHDMTE